MSVMDNEGHDPQGFLNTPQYRSGTPEVAELKAEIERLRTERDELFKTNGELANTVAADALRLRAALQTLIDNVETGSYESTGMAIDQAKAALAVIHQQDASVTK